MDYGKVYNQIIERAQKENRKKGVGDYYENHHVLPKCIGGDNTEANLVLLTAREHFICHWLLARQYNTPKLWFALHAMGTMKNTLHRRYTPSSRAYAESREECSKARIGTSSGMKGKKHSKESREKISKANLGRKKTQEQIEAMKAALFGIKRTEETKQKISKAKQGNKNPTKRPEVALKISLANRGRVSNRKNATLSDSTKSLISKAQKGIKKGKQPLSKCTHCGKEGGTNSITRWHNVNCKYKQSN